MSSVVSSMAREPSGFDMLCVFCVAPVEDVVDCCAVTFEVLDRLLEAALVCDSAFSLGSSSSVLRFMLPRVVRDAILCGLVTVPAVFVTSQSSVVLFVLRLNSSRGKSKLQSRLLNQILTN